MATVTLVNQGLAAHLLRVFMPCKTLMKGKMKKTLAKKAIKHLEGDMKGYKKERKDLKGEIKEDIELKKALKKTIKRKKK